jgi:Ca2+-binding RTX toxin-like protein
LTATLANGVLTVTGTEGPDGIQVEPLIGGRLAVTEVSLAPPPTTTGARPPRPTPTRTVFAAADVSAVVVNSLGGNDAVSVYAVKPATTTTPTASTINPRSTARPPRPTPIPATINAGAGNDRVNGNLGDDEINGGEGNDILLGGPGADTIHGGAGRDRIDGGAGVDALFGDAGNDVFFAFDRDNDTIDGGDNDPPTSDRPGDVAYINQGDVTSNVERVVTITPGMETIVVAV